MRLKVLVVEDETQILDDILLTLGYISPDNKNHYGIESLSVTKARWALEAEGILESAADSSEPYDILLLDLRLPEYEGGEIIPDRGMPVLRMARERRAAKEILIYSILEDYQLAVGAFLGGAVDFINKRVRGEELMTRVLSSGARVLLNESTGIIRERIGELLPYAEKGLAHQFSAHFSRFVQAVVHEAEGIALGLRERLGLDIKRDSQDSLVRHLTALDEAIRTSKQEWVKLQATLSNGDEMPEVRVVEEILGEIKESLLPCLTVKRTEVVGLWDGETQVLSFQGDVQAVLKEIIVGGLGGLSDYGDSPKKIEVAVGIKEERAEVRVNDNLPPISPDAASSINEGLTMIPDHRFGRAWGLSVAQHVALRGGGRLIVKPQKQGNLITYLIPLAHHA